MRFAFIMVLVLLTACASPAYVTDLEANLTAAAARAAVLDAQLAEATLELNQTDQNLRKYDALYEAKVQEVKSLEQEVTRTKSQLTFEQLQRAAFQKQYEECVAKYAPKVASSAAGYVTVPYDDLMRYSDDHVGEKVRYRGEVLQVNDNGDGSFTLRIGITEEAYGFTDAVWVEYDGPRVLEDDLVMLQGTFVGLHTYTAVLGNAVTIPEVNADLITVLEKAGER